MKQAIAIFQRDSFLYFTAIMISIILSALISSQESIINRDAICYILSAQTIGQSGLSAAVNVCPQANWPFYSVLVYGLSKILPFSFITNAYLLNGFFTVISVTAFIAIIQTLGGNRRLLWLAAYVILFSYIFNNVRQYIVRDHGYWAFYLTSICFLLLYMKDQKWRYALSWALSMMLATLFRIEGAIFLILLPFISWLDTSITIRQRAGVFLKLYTPFLIIITLGATWLTLHPDQALTKFGRIHEVVEQFQHAFTQISERYFTTLYNIKISVLPSEAQRDSGLVLFLTMISLFFIYIFGNLTLLYSILVGYAWYSHAAIFSRKQLLVIGSYLLVNFVIASAFFAEHLFLSKRYLVALSLILMLWVPFALNKLWERANSPRFRSLFAFAVFAIFLNTLSNFFTINDPKVYIRDSGKWIAENIPADAKIFMNDQQLMFYSQHFKTDLFQAPRQAKYVVKDRWKNYDYLALMVRKNKDDKFRKLVQVIPMKPMIEFSNGHQDIIAIYQVNQKEITR